MLFVSHFYKTIFNISSILSNLQNYSKRIAKFDPGMNVNIKIFHSWPYTQPSQSVTRAVGRA